MTGHNACGQSFTQDVCNAHRYDVNDDGYINYQDAGIVWMHREELQPYDATYDMNEDRKINFMDAGLTWLHRYCPIVQTNGPYHGTMDTLITFEACNSNTPNPSVDMYYWDFGDGHSASGKVVYHSYSTIDTFTVTVTVTGQNGCCDQRETVAIIDSGDQGTPLIQFVSFDVRRKILITSAETGIQWDSVLIVGDCNTDHLGDYVTVGDEITQCSGTITISYLPTNTLLYTHTFINQPPTASATATPTTGKAPLTVQFTGSGTDIDGFIQIYHWDFDDGNTSTLQHPTHTFQSPGTYLTTLLVIDNEGAASTDTVIITVLPVNQPPVASIECTATAFTGETILFDASESFDVDGDVVSYRWDYGPESSWPWDTWDTNWGSSPYSTHTYESPGSYVVRVQVRDNDGATDIANVLLTINTAYPISIGFSHSIQLPSIISDAKSITWSGSYYYVLDGTDNTIYKLKNDFSYTGLHVDCDNFCKRLEGITYQDGYIYGVGVKYDMVIFEKTWIFKLSKQLVKIEEHNIDCYITNPSDIESTNDHLYVSHKDDHKIAQFKITDYCYQKTIHTSSDFISFAVAKNNEWLFTNGYGGDTHRLYLFDILGNPFWNTVLLEQNDINLKDNNTMLCVRNTYAYFYNIGY